MRRMNGVCHPERSDSGVEGSLSTVKLNNKPSVSFIDNPSAIGIPPLEDSVGMTGGRLRGFAAGATRLLGLKMGLGFTFVELLVVITIIAVLSGVAAVSFTNTSRRSRDARRKLDIENIRSALELCRTESGSYPLSIYDSIVCNVDGVDETYLDDTPEDPKTAANYTYVRSSLTSYSVSCVLESGGDCSFTNP